MLPKRARRVGLGNASTHFAEGIGVASPPCLSKILGICILHGAVKFVGSLSVAVKLAEETVLTYNSADLNTPTTLPT